MLKLTEKDYPLSLIKFNVAHINLCTEAEGPYRRMAIWFQGCSIGCVGCCNPELQEFKTAHIMTADELVDIAVRSRDDNSIEGVTFLGGEPTLQKNLSDLAYAFRQNGLGIILFTGYEISELSDELLANVDIIIDGKFDINKIDNVRNLVGSTNQRIYYLTERYSDATQWFENGREKRVEINLNLSSDLFVSGDVI